MCICTHTCRLYKPPPSQGSYRKDSEALLVSDAHVAHSTHLILSLCVSCRLLTRWLASLPVASLSPQDDEDGADQEKAMAMVGLRTGMGESRGGSVALKAEPAMLGDGKLQRGAGTPARVLYCSQVRWARSPRLPPSCFLRS